MPSFQLRILWVSINSPLRLHGSEMQSFSKCVAWLCYRMGTWYTISCCIAFHRVTLVIGEIALLTSDTNNNSVHTKCMQWHRAGVLFSSSFFNDEASECVRPLPYWWYGTTPLVSTEQRPCPIHTFRPLTITGHWCSSICCRKLYRLVFSKKASMLWHRCWFIIFIGRKCSVSRQLHEALPDENPDIAKSCRPISNLFVRSKPLERFVTGSCSEIWGRRVCCQI